MIFLNMHNFIRQYANELYIVHTHDKTHTRARAEPDDDDAHLKDVVNQKNHKLNKTKSPTI